MSQPALPDQYDIEQKNTPDKRTEGQDEMADVLEEHWGTGKTLDQMAAIAGYSRQHARNCLSNYYNMIEKTENTDGNEDITITIPSDVENPADYLRAVTDMLEAQ